MADRLTQLQDAIDEYLIHCFAALNYNWRHHPYADVPNQPDQAPPTVSASDPPTTPPKPAPAPALTNGEAVAIQPYEIQRPESPDRPEKDHASDKPHSREEHAASLRELAQGIVLKEQQMEILINSLPGVGSSEEDQERRIKELREELRMVEAERKEKEVVREKLVDQLGDWLVGCRRVP